MTLSNEDVAQIEKKGHRDFWVCIDGYLYLRNVDGKCIFLEEGLCSIYGYRPLGCRLYPVIFDDEEKTVFLDDFCPDRDRFRIEPWHRPALAKAIAEEDAEREERLSSSSE